MLCLNRKVGQEVIAQFNGALLRVVVVAIEKGHMRIGFEAPREVLIHRKEIWDQIQANQSAPDRPDAPMAGG